jgi:hypothetical protein
MPYPFGTTLHRPPLRTRSVQESHNGHSGVTPHLGIRAWAILGGDVHAGAIQRAAVAQARGELLPRQAGRRGQVLTFRDYPFGSRAES